MTEVRTRDFSTKPRKLDFTADGETYECFPKVAPEVLQDMLRISRSGKLTEDLAALDELFELVMPTESADRIKPRFRRTHENPLDLGQMLDILHWLIEEYSVRPTTPSVNSSTSSQTDSAGTSSTAGLSSEESTPSS